MKAWNPDIDGIGIFGWKLDGRNEDIGVVILSK